MKTYLICFVSHPLSAVFSDFMSLSVLFHSQKTIKENIFLF